MGIRFLCPACSKKLNIKAHLAGKRGICPHCQAKLLIPVESEGADTPDADPPDSDSPRSDTPDADTTVLWYVGHRDGRQFGPADDERMAQWLAEGRVPPESLVWREGWDQWQPVDEVFRLADPVPIPTVSPPPMRDTSHDPPVAREIASAEGSLASVSLVSESPDAEPRDNVSVVDSLPAAGTGALDTLSTDAEQRARSRRSRSRVSTTALLILLLGASLVLGAVLFYVLTVGPIVW